MRSPVAGAQFAQGLDQPLLVQCPPLSSCLATLKQLVSEAGQPDPVDPADPQDLGRPWDRLGRSWPQPPV